MKTRFLIFLIVSAAAAFLLAKHDTAGGGETARFSVVESVLERGTFVIAHDEEVQVINDGVPETRTRVVNDSFFSTPDKGKRDGRYYGDKPPLLTFGVIAWGWLLKCFGVRFLRNDYHGAVYLTNVLIFILSSLTGWFFYVGLRRRKRMPEGYRVAMSVLSVASTLVLSYSVVLNNHTLCAAAMMGLILLMERCEETGMTRLRAFLLGILTGLLFNLEFVTGGVMGVAVFVFVLTAIAPRRIENALMYAAGAGLLILSEAGMNMVSYGSPLPLYLSTHKPSFAEKNYLSYAFNILFGFEGFFLYMPALLFAGFACASKRMRRDRVFATMMASAAAAMFLFAVGTSDYGGWCYGYRFLIPFAPVLLYYAAIYFGRPRPRLKRWVLFRLALLWGIVFSVVGVMNPWNYGYDGSPEFKKVLGEDFRNGFLANCFVFFWKASPDSFITMFFMNDVYMPDKSMMYLLTELAVRKDEDGIMRIFRQSMERKKEMDAEPAAGAGADPLVPSVPAGQEAALSGTQKKAPQIFQPFDPGSQRPETVRTGDPETRPE